MIIVFNAIVLVAAVGFICAVLLAVASKVMAVQVDERQSELRACLPGANCGACGYSGCDAYAAAVISGKAASNLCLPGGNDLVGRINEIMGLSSEGIVVKKTAVVHCIGSADKKSLKMEYSGILSCRAASLHYGGQNACAFGCAGLGDCQRVCPSEAICIEKSLAHIDSRNCIGCGLCVKTCPYGLIFVQNTPVKVAVMCKNTEKGAQLKGKCKVGCIACMKCEKECPNSAITVTDFLARIDYTKCVGCLKCVDICVKKCISSF